MLALDNQRRRIDGFCRLNIRRRRAAKGGEVGGIVAPHLTKPFLGGHDGRHHRNIIIFNNIVASHPLLELRYRVGCPQQRVERQLEKGDLAILRALIQALCFYRHAEVKAGVGKSAIKLEMISTMPALFIDDMVGRHGAFLLRMGCRDDYATISIRLPSGSLITAS